MITPRCPLESENRDNTKDVIIIIYNDNRRNLQLKSFSESLQIERACGMLGSMNKRKTH